MPNSNQYNNMVGFVMDGHIYWQLCDYGFSIELPKVRMGDLCSQKMVFQNVKGTTECIHPNQVCTGMGE